MYDGASKLAGQRPAATRGGRRGWTSAIVITLALVAAPHAAGATVASVTVRMSANSITQGQTTYVLGSASAGIRRVVVQRGVAGRWADRQQGAVTAAGTFKVAIKPSQSGIYALRARSDDGGAVSGAVYLRVTPDRSGLAHCNRTEVEAALIAIIGPPHHSANGWEWTKLTCVDSWAYAAYVVYGASGIGETYDGGWLFHWDGAHWREADTGHNAADSACTDTSIPAGFQFVCIGG